MNSIKNKYAYVLKSIKKDASLKPKLSNLKNKTYVISGASRGIGLSIANFFAEIGHTVIGTSRSDFQFEKKLPNLISYKLDINCRESIQSCVKYLTKEDMLPNILINNAGITSDQIFLRMKLIVI